MEAKSRGLRVSGKKMDLVARLEEDDMLQRRLERAAAAEDGEGAGGGGTAVGEAEALKVTVIMKGSEGGSMSQL
jgi:hypothetical protein